MEAGGVMAKEKRSGALNRRQQIAALVILIVAGALLSNPGFFPFLRDALRLPTAATSTPLPTYTPIPPLPTYTPFPTFTVEPTDTPTNTATMTNTSTATPTITRTVMPTDTPTNTPTYTALPPLPTYTPYPTYTVPPTSTPTNTATPIPVLQYIQEMGQLVVISAEFARGDIHVAVNDGACSHGADHVAEGVIETGIDFNAIDEDNIERHFFTGDYTIELPPPVVTSCRMDYIRQYEGSFTLCGANWDTVRMLAQYQAMSDFISRIEENRILERAENHASIIVGSFVSGLTGRNAQIVFEPGDDEPTLPSSCKPEIPEGWHFDEASRAWSQSN